MIGGGNADNADSSDEEGDEWYNYDYRYKPSGNNSLIKHAINYHSEALTNQGIIIINNPSLILTIKSY